MHQIFDTIRSSKNFLLESHQYMKPMQMSVMKNNEKASMMVEGTIRDSNQFIVQEAPLHEEMTRLHTPGDNETRNGGTLNRNNSAFDSFKDGSVQGSQKDLNGETAKDPNKDYSIYVDPNEDTTNLYRAVYRK